MTRLMTVALGVALAAPTWAQAPAVPEPGGAPTGDKGITSLPTTIAPQPVHPVEPFSRRQLDLGFFSSDSNSTSSKFLEYRDVPGTGAIPFARLAGGETLRYDFAAWNALQDDARYGLRASQGSFRLQAQYTGIPHRFGNDARSLLQNVGGGVLALPQSVQKSLQAEIERQFAANKAGVNYAFLNALLADYLAAAQPFSIELLRKQARVDLDLTHGRPVETRLSFYQENRNGNRGAGTSFGFGNVVETPEPIDYRTRDLGLSVEWKPTWGLVRGAAHLNEFTNFIPMESFDNPFRGTDATDPSAYTGPASGSIGGATLGRLALPPDNRAVTGSVGATFKLARRSRLTVDTSLSRWTQDEAFIPFTSNSAITAPVRATDLAALPRPSLDGRIDVFSFASTFSSNPVGNLRLVARLRRYDLDNKTPRVELQQGYVRFDAVWEDIPRVSVPYGYTNDQLHASAAWDFGRLTLEGGYKLDRMDRTFRETSRTTQNVGYASVHLRTAGWAVLRGTYERGSRSVDQYDFERSEDASFLEPQAPANLPDLRRYDQAAKDLDRLTTQLQISPGNGSTTLALSYVLGKDDYTESAFGLQKVKNETLTADLGYAPSERLSTYLFYSFENLATSQRGRQSAATPSTNPLDDWTADIRDKGNTFGLGLDAALKPQKLDLKLYGSYQNLDGNNDISSPVGGAPELARRSLGGILDIPLFDDTRIWTVNGELLYHLKDGWRVGVGAWLEDYRLQDAASTGLVNYVPGALFLNGNDGSYRAHVVYGRLTYTW